MTNKERDIIAGVTTLVVAGLIYLGAEADKRPSTNPALTPTPTISPPSLAQKEPTITTTDDFRKDAQQLWDVPQGPNKLTFSQAMEQLGWKITEVGVFGVDPHQGIVGKDGSYVRNVPVQDTRIVDLTGMALGIDSLKAGKSVSWIAEFQVENPEKGTKQRFGLIYPPTYNPNHTKAILTVRQTSRGPEIVEVSYVWLGEKLGENPWAWYVEGPFTSLSLKNSP